MTKTLVSGAALCFFLAACADDGALQPATQAGTTTLPSGGVYRGTVEPHRAATLLMLFDGTAYLFYAAPSPADKPGGVVVALKGAQSGGGQFRSANARDYSLQTGLQGSLQPGKVSPGTFSVDFSKAPAIDGVMTPKAAGAGNLRFSATADQMLGEAPSFGAIAGLYSGRGGSTAGTVGSQITVTQDGRLAGTTSFGCEFRGTVAPREGVNAYNVSIAFGPAPCPAAGASATGNAVLDGAHLLAALPSVDGSDVFVFDGTK
jgi:hypothetical protein